MSTTIGPGLVDETRARRKRLFDFLADANSTAAEAIRLIRSGADRLRDHPRPGRPHAGRPPPRAAPLLRRRRHILRDRLEGDTVAIIRVRHRRAQRG